MQKAQCDISEERGAMAASNQEVMDVQGSTGFSAFSVAHLQRVQNAATSLTGTKKKKKKTQVHSAYFGLTALAGCRFQDSFDNYFSF